MKNKFLLFAILVFGFATANAQGGPPQPRTVEERVKTVHEKMDSAFKPGDAKLKEIDDMAGGTRPTREEMMEKMKPAVTERDDKLKKVLSEEQFKKWKEEIEPAMRPQRRQQ